MNDTRIKHNNKLKSEHKDGIPFQLVVEFGNWAVLKLQLFLDQICILFRKVVGKLKSCEGNAYLENTLHTFHNLN